MPSHVSSRLPLLTLVSSVATVALTAAHHIFRLGLEMAVPAVIMVLVLAGSMWAFVRTRRRSALWVYTAANVLIFVWFGLVDGFLDHVLKAVGLANVTVLAGSEAEVVETVYSLWSPAAGNLFYELTGVLTFVVGAVAVTLNVLLLRTRGDRPAAAPVAADAPATVGG